MSKRKRDLDVVVVGAGPAGISAGIWCAELGLRTGVLERGSRIGGQLPSIHGAINNYPGLPSPNGEALLSRFEESAAQLEGVFRLGCAIAEIDVDSTSVVLESGEHISAGAIVLATGVRRRALGIPGETEFAGKGILSSGVGERNKAAGKRVAIVGGGDAAFENALILAEHAEKVFLIHRSDSYRARREFVEKLLMHPRIEVMPGQIVEKISGGGKLESVHLRDTAAGRSAATLPADLLLIRVGVEPNSELLKGKADLDGQGYVKVDFLRRTSLPDIFAIGDVANPLAPTISTAVGDGAVVAKGFGSLGRALRSAGSAENPNF